MRQRLSISVKISFAVIIFLTSISFSFLHSPLVSAVSPSEWKAGRIIDDSVFDNKNSMSVAQIQQFLESKVPSCDTYGQVGGGWRATRYPSNPPPFTCLKDYKEVPKTTPGGGVPANNYGRTDGTAPDGSKSAAELIWDAAQTYNINPKVLLVNLQKESGLITDDWPLKNQFVYAMGARCPDSGPGGSANCDVNYSGFSMQIRESARLFRYYIDNMQQPWWDNKRPFQTNTIQYDVDVSCGSSGVFMETKATTALYVYTPYQPTAAALAAGYGTAEPCGAYGNRNFWLYYNDWFGSPINRDFQVMKSSTGTQQYVVYNGMKQAIPSPYIKVAWGLDNFPLESVDQSFINSLSNGPNLDIVFRVNGGMDLYMVDSGTKYRIQTTDMMKTWGLNGRVISNVPTGLSIVPANGGELSYTARASGMSPVYMLDGVNSSQQTILRRYNDPNVLFGIEGLDVNIITVSSDLFSSIDNDIEPDITSTKAAYGSNEYQLVSKQKLFQSASLAPLYPGVATRVSDITFGRFINSLNATPFIKSYSSPQVYLVQNGKKQHITSPNILNGWVGSGNYVNIVNQNYADTIPTDPSPVTTTVAASSDKTYVLDSGSKITIPDSLSTAYKSSEFSISNQLGLNITDSSKTISRFVRNTATQQIFLLTNSSTLIPISSIQMAQLWGVNGTNTQDLPPETISKYTISSTVLNGYVSNGVTNYLLLDGKLHDFDNNVWKLTNPQIFSDGSLDSFIIGDPISSVTKSGTRYYKIIDGIAYLTTDQKISSAWGLTEQSTDSSLLISIFLPNLHMLTPIAFYNNSYYIADSNKIYRMTESMYRNLNLNYPVMYMNPQSTGMTVSDWSVPLFTNSSGGSYVIDNGSLRTFSHIVILSHWMNGISSQPVTVSNNFISMFRSGSPIERAIKTISSPAIYSAEGAKKRWILSAQSYNNLYAPYTLVSQQLVDSMTQGPNIP